MSESQHCPDVTRLQALLDGNLPEESQAAMAAHLEACAKCRRQLELLASGTVSLPRDATPPERRSPALEQVMQRLKTEASEATQTQGQTHAGPLTFSFLKPSQNPRHLGRLGGYEILELIGRGGMGIVFKARDTKLERLVAIKVLAPELATSVTARQRFHGEAQKMAAVTHDQVVSIHAVDEANGTPFLVMEYIVGVSLEDRIQRTGHLRVEEILRIGMQAASGLAAAHAQGLVHRDIKPSNILLENGIERVKITDFGLARVIHEAQATQSNVIAGTPPYMSPEQARGQTVDHRSDLFSLGCVLYAMCVGRSPFRAETPTGSMHRVCEDTPRPLREINPDIPDWLAAVIDRLLEKKPEDRFQSANEVADVLGQYLAHVQQPSQVALPVGRRAIGISQRQRHVWPWLAASGGLLALILLTVIASRLFDNRSTRMQAGVTQIETGGGPGNDDEPDPRFAFVDMSKQANQELTSAPEPAAPLNTLAELNREIPNRILRVGDIPVRVDRRYIQLQGERVPNCPQGVRGIMVNRRAAKLHFLHGCIECYREDGATVAAYTIHYHDGTEATMPVIAGRHLRNWWVPVGWSIQATRASVAWTGTNPAASNAKCRIVLFLCDWENPHPEKIIATVDFQRGPLKRPAPFCMGITLDDDPTPLPPEPGLVRVHVANDTRYSAVIDGSLDSPLKGDGEHDTLLLGRHKVKTFCGETVIREGFIDVQPGTIISLAVGYRTRHFPLPVPQPAPATELIGQGGGIWRVVFSGDGKLLAAAAGDGTVRLRQGGGMASRPDAILKAHAWGARTVALSPTSGLAAVGCEAGPLKLFDVNSGQNVATLGDDKVGVLAVAFSPDGTILAAGNEDGSVDLWDVAAHNKIASFPAHSHKVLGVVFSPDGTLVATGASGEPEVQLWDVRSRSKIRMLRAHTDSITGLAFSPDGKTLASCSTDSTVRLWTVATGQHECVFGAFEGLNAVAFSLDGTMLAAGGDFQTVRIWDVPSRTVTNDFQAHWDAVRSLAFSPDGKTLVTTGADNLIRSWTLTKLPGPFEAQHTTAKPGTTFACNSDDWGVCVAVSPKGDYLAHASVFNGVEMCNLGELRHVAKLGDIKSKEAGWMWTSSLAFEPNGSRLLTFSTDAKLSDKGIHGQHVRVWDTGDFKLLGDLPGEEGFGFMALSPDGSMLATVGRQPKNVVRVLDPKMGNEINRVTSVHGEPRCAAFSPDGATLAVVTQTGYVLLHDPKTGKQRSEPLLHGKEGVDSIAFSPDGSVFATGGNNKIVRLWDASAFGNLGNLEGHREMILSSAFSPDGTILVTAGGASILDKAPWQHEGEVCFWDVGDRKLLTKFNAHYGSVTCAVFSQDGKSLATTGCDGKVHLWDVAELLKWQGKPEAK